MPRAHNGEVSLYYETDGEGPTVAFVNDVGYGAWLWGWQHPALAGPFETLVWDLPGTGRSDASPGSPAVADFAADLEAVLSAHGARTVHLVGAGLGGMIALQYALEYGRAGTLALCSTAASGAAVDEAALAALFASPDEPAALRASLDAAFAPGVADAHPDVIDRIAGWRADDDADRAGWEAQAGALRAFDCADRLHEVTTPALVVHGREDRIVPFAAGESLAERLPRGEFVAVDGGHLCFVSASRAVTDALAGFLDDHADATAD